MRFLFFLLLFGAIFCNAQENLYSENLDSQKKLKKTQTFDITDEQGRRFAPTIFDEQTLTQAFLSSNSQRLDLIFSQIAKQTLEQNFVRFRGRVLVEHNALATLSVKQRKNLNGALVVSKFYMVEFIKYSVFGGVGVGARLKLDDEQARYFSFDGRYYTDLQNLMDGAILANAGGKEKDFVPPLVYAMCVLPRFDKCIMLGIKEEW